MSVGLADFVRMTESLYFGPVFPCGHKKTPENIYKNGKKKRCAECTRAYAAERYRRKYG